MRTLLSLFAALFIALSLFAGTADARSTRQPTVQKQRVGILARLIELERRKNAWLRRTFLQ